LFLNAGIDVHDGWRTDGTWVWPASYRTLAETRGPLLDHAAVQGFTVGEVDGVARHLALVAVQRFTAAG
jgi:hypothetical protein